MKCIRTTALSLTASALLLAATGCGAISKDSHESGTSETSAADGASRAGAEPYDIKPLLHPGKKYFGMAAQGVPASMKPVDDFAEAAGKKPNLIAYYAAWGDGFDAGHAMDVWDKGALPFISWEPFKESLADIAAGKSDDYIRRYAQSVRELNIPVGITFAHEMNGHWYPWGAKTATAEQFVAAWKHIHDIFEQEKATTVIWTWSPNIIYPMPDVKLKPYWPGDEYVDWVGVIGYYVDNGPRTFQTLFGPTMTQVRTFTKKPFIIPETASAHGERKPADINDLFKGVAARDDVLGFVWFNLKKESDWRIDSGPISKRTFRANTEGDDFGFDPGKLG
ncbi:glycoside hydrolase family 26 protein [Streptomyces sp. NBC_01304]|uniref:glycoside hydrolase family 26 protein n=1 Tax=Streptomyces sp. NBC_01304 TaxID=2903818 RepID=UPI002E142CED|nr:glycosyl hydrolase [Streptomyces sp. NBC_01304]